MTRQSQPTVKSGARRWFRFGPGLLLAIIASAIVWQRQPLRAPARTVPEAADYLKSSSQAKDGAEFVPAFSTAPDPDWLLSQRTALALNAEQTRKMESLRARWQRETRASRAMLARASEQFERDMKSIKERAITLPELQERATSVTELSRQLAQARRAWWSEASGLLSVEQRQRAEREWARRFLAPPPRAKKTGDTK
ncbi:MAG: hypothetical protein KY445_00880 [Armatimonadetes bacterium]|nr:hypothetical protein [Armatimonadota bacterium]